MTDARRHDREDEAVGGCKTITLSDRDLRAATRLLSLLLGMEEDPGKGRTRMAEANGRQDRGILLERARQTFGNRAQRARHFNPAMFGEAGWDMLLALYVTELSGTRHTVSGLLNLSGVPPTTALRWLDFLENKEQLVIRRANPVDKRVFLIELTDKARDALDAYFSGTATTGM